MSPPSDRKTRPDNPPPRPVPGVPGTDLPDAGVRARHPSAEPESSPPPRSISPFPERQRTPAIVEQVTPSKRPPPPWVALLGSMLATVGKWVATASAPFLAAGALWLYARIETEKALSAKLQAEAKAIEDARVKLDGDMRKLRSCAQAIVTWQQAADRMDRAVFEQLGARVRGGEHYDEVEFKPAPLAGKVKGDSAPPIQPKEALPPAPDCEL